MKFQLTPVLSLMEEIYRMPIGQERFRAYINILNGGDKDKLAVPIGGYNPMAKEVVLERLLKMKKLGAEEIAKKALFEINKKFETSEKVIKVGLNLVDNLGGAWSSFFQTKYESIFKFNGVFNYDFCAPYFWMSEEITEELIQKRTQAYAWRTVFWLQNGRPKTLEDHLNQEVLVFKNLPKIERNTAHELEQLNQLFQKNKVATDDRLIFNFFFGDKASSDLDYPTYGVDSVTGFDLAKAIVKRE